MHKLVFVLRSLNGRFDACLSGAGKTRAAWASRPIQASAAFGAFSRLLAIPLLVMLVIAVAVAFMTRQFHLVPVLASAPLSAHAPAVSSLAIGVAGITADATKTHDELQKLIKEFRETLEQSADEKKKYGDARAETEKKLERMQAAMDGFEIKMQRALTGGRSEDDVEVKRTERDHLEKKAITRYARSGDETELKALSTDSDPDGGYAVPHTMSDRIINKLIQFSNIRALATVETLTKGSGLDIPAEGAQNFEAGWVGERAPRNETQSGRLRMEKIPAHEMYAKPLISQTQLDDESFDLESWSQDRVARRLAVYEGQAFIAGDGNAKPEGMLTHPDVPFVVSGSASAITTDGMFDLMADLPTDYALQSTIIGNRKTKYALRKLKDSQNRYLWEPSLQAGMPAAFDATPFVEIVDMPAIAANSFPVLYGDFKSAYTIVDRQGIRLLRDPYTSKPFIELYFTKRTGGQVVLAEALRKLKISA